MYGNFDAIKRRAKLRKETTSGRQERVNSIKNGLSSDNKAYESFPAVDSNTQARVKSEIQERFRIKRKKEHIRYLFLIVAAALILSLLAWKFIFS